MASAIDATKPVTGQPKDPADFRANFAAAKAEIEALQAAVIAGGVPATRQVIAADSLQGGGALSADVTLRLDGDVPTPLADHVYGTNSSGAKGWKPDPAGGGGVPTSRQVATISSIQGGGDLSADRTLSLVGDTGTPAANQVYGTNSGGARGWKPDGAPTTRLISTVSSIQGGGDLSANRSLSLVGDTATPLADHVYGTNSSGARGWKPDPAAGGVPTSRIIGTQHSIVGGGDLAANRLLSLENDSPTPGANRVYGTNASGVRGWKADPSGPGGSSRFDGAVIYAEDYSGVNANGTGDSAAGINAAILDASNYSVAGQLRGGRVQLLHGTYLIGSSIVMRSLVELCGINWTATTIEVASGANCRAVRTFNNDQVLYGIHDLGIFGNAEGQAAENGSGRIAYDPTTGLPNVADVGTDFGGVYMINAKAEPSAVGDYRFLGGCRSWAYNLLIQEVAGNGFVAQGNSGWMVDRIQVRWARRYGLYIDTNDGSFDQLIASRTGWAGMFIDGASTRFNNIKVWFNGVEMDGWMLAKAWTAANDSTANGRQFSTNQKAGVGVLVRGDRNRILCTDVQDTAGHGAYIHGRFNKLQLTLDQVGQVNAGGSTTRYDDGLAGSDWVDLNPGLPLCGVYVQTNQRGHLDAYVHDLTYQNDGTAPGVLHDALKHLVKSDEVDMALDVYGHQEIMQVRATPTAPVVALGPWTLNGNVPYAELAGAQSLTALVAPAGGTIANTGAAATWTLPSRVPSTAASGHVVRLTIHNVGTGAITLSPAAGVTLVGATSVPSSPQSTVVVEWTRLRTGTERVVVREAPAAAGAFGGDFNATAAVDYTTPTVLSVSGLLNQAAHGGRPCHLSGNVTVPVANGFTCELANKSGAPRNIGPESGDLIHNGVRVPGDLITLPDLRSVTVRSDGTDVWVYGALS